MKLYQTFISIAAAGMLLTGCGSSSTTSSTKSGKLVDSALYGVSYTCGQTEANTTQDGTFACTSLPVTFSVGGVTLGTVGEIPEDGYVTPYELANVARGEASQMVENLVVFLQSLDDDGEIDSRITVASEYVERLKNIHTDLHALTEGEVVELLVSIESQYIVSVDEALLHLSTQMETIDSFIGDGNTTYTPTVPSIDTNGTTTMPTL